LSIKVPLTIAAFVLCAGITVTVIPSMSGAQGKDTPQPVELKAPLPLPVRGTVDVGNLAAVLSKTFTVRPDPNAPPFVVRLAPLSLIRRTETMILTDYGQLCQAVQVAQVPEPNKLVIEHVSVLFRVPTGQRITFVALEASGTGTGTPWQVIDIMKPEALGPLQAGYGSAQLFVVDHDTRTYVAGGENLQFQWCRDVGGATVVAELAVNGFYQ
jgi:hypothetical protein